MAEKYPSQTSPGQIQTTADHAGPVADPNESTDQTEPETGHSEAKPHPADSVTHQLNKMTMDQDTALQMAHDAAAAAHPGRI